VGISSGAYLFSSLISFLGLRHFEKLKRLCLLTSLVALASALLTIVLDLGHWERFWYVFVYPSPSSMMSWMVWLYSAYFLLVLLQIIYTFRNSEKKAHILAMIGMPLAIAIPVCGGSLFGVIGARPYWHSAMFPIIFLFEALLSGMSLITLVSIIFGFSRQDGEGLFNILPRLILGLLIVNITLEAAVLAVPLWGQVAYHIEAVKLVLFGPFWWVFWLVHIGLGSAIPLFLLLGKPNLTKLSFASGLIALTFMSVRLNIVIPALAIPELKGLESAFIEKRLMFSYVPSFHEWQVSLFIVSLAVGLFYLGMKLLPALEIKRPK
jgi:molybdopterin-containing oxidoreductase family membrane subunit